MLAWNSACFVSQRWTRWPRQRSLRWKLLSHQLRGNNSDMLLMCCFIHLDDLSNKDASSHQLLKEELRLLPLSSKMNMIANQKVMSQSFEQLYDVWKRFKHDFGFHSQKAAVRSCSLGDTVRRSRTSNSLCQEGDEILEDEESPRQRRITVGNDVQWSLTSYSCRPDLLNKMTQFKNNDDESGNFCQYNEKP